MKYRCFLPVLLILITGCNKEILKSQTEKNSLLGTWVKLDSLSAGSIKVFTKQDTFKKYAFGYSFMKNNKLTVRVKLACGKPPIYQNTEGTYQLSGKSLHLSYKVSGRPNEFDLLIKKLNPDTLILEY